jgi:thioredoxin 1
MSKSGESRDNGSACGCGGGGRCSGSGKWIWIVLALAVVGVLIAKNTEKAPGASQTAAVTETTDGKGSVAEGTMQGAHVPRLIDLGATKCIPCKMMVPILDDLKKTYAGKLDVQFIDVWENPDAGKKYGINVIPTQIFYDAAGKELFRHEGFFGKEDILAKWKELGVELDLR